MARYETDARVLLNALTLACSEQYQSSGECPIGYFGSEPWMDEAGNDSCSDICDNHSNDPIGCWIKYFINEAKRQMEQEAAEKRATCRDRRLNASYKN